jgi:hypothetical protein
VAFSPSTQQLVQYESKALQKDSPQAWVPRAERYSRGHIYNINAVSAPETEYTGYKEAVATADFSMQSAVLYGVNEPHELVVQQLRSQCPSQDCNWPESYTSLSVCSRCQDMTDRLRKKVLPGNSGTIATELEVDAPPVCGTMAHTTKYTLPNGLFIDGIDGWAYDPSNRKSYCSVEGSSTADPCERARYNTPRHPGYVPLF